jgi:NAD-dependent DNA ligase
VSPPASTVSPRAGTTPPRARRIETTLTPIAFRASRSIGWPAQRLASGSVVERAHDHRHLRSVALYDGRKGERIGDRVIVRRAGDVIPGLVGRMPEHRAEAGGDGSAGGLPGARPRYMPNFRMPFACPVCGSRVLRGKGSVEHRCRACCTRSASAMSARRRPRTWRATSARSSR